MKHRFLGFALIALVAAGFSACTKGRSGLVVENEKEIHIRVWESKNGIDEFIKKAGKAYTALHPNVIVDFINVELHNTVATLAADAPNGVAPDIIAAPHDNLGSLVSQKLILPTENPKDISKQVLGACSKALTYNGTMYGYPASAETYALFYNKHLISEREVPKSWEELVTWVKNFNASHPGQYGFVMDVTNVYYSILFTTANGKRNRGK